MTICRNDLKQISTLDRQIKSYSTSASNPLVREGEERRGREGEERRGREAEERERGRRQRY